ncbi:MAG: lysostaphin resistance A-like protein, partial [Blastocatellia bacterium]
MEATNQFMPDQIVPVEPQQPETYQPTPNNPPWNSWTAVGVWVASILFLVIFATLFVMPYLFAQGLNTSDEAVVKNFLKTDPIAVLLQMLAVFPAHLFTLFLAWLVVTRYKKYSFRETLGWKMNGFRLWHAFAISIGFYALAIAAVQIFGDVENDFDVMLKSSKWIVYIVAVFAVFTAPIVEEVVYRGILYSAFQRTFGVTISLVFVTILFAAVHGLQYSQDTTPDYTVMGLLLLSSFVLTIIRIRTGR